MKHQLTKYFSKLLGTNQAKIQLSYVNNVSFSCLKHSINFKNFHNFLSTLKLSSEFLVPCSSRKWCHSSQQRTAAAAMQKRSCPISKQWALLGEKQSLSLSSTIEILTYYFYLYALSPLFFALSFSISLFLDTSLICLQVISLSLSFPFRI